MYASMPSSLTDPLQADDVRLRFEAMLADVFVRFVHLPPEEVDAAIEDTQKKVCASLGIDRSTFWEVSSHGRMTLTHVWQPSTSPAVIRQPDQSLLKNADWVLENPGISAIPIGVDAECFFPQVLSSVGNHQSIIIPDVNAMPDSAARERALMLRFGVKSNAIFPLVSGGQLLGTVTFEMLSEARQWPDYVIRRFELVSQAFAAALARRQAEWELRQSNARLSLATDGANVGLWSLDTATGSWWVTDRCRELFGFPPGTPVDWPRISAAIEPEDRARVQEVTDSTIRSGADGSVEFRVHLPDGAMRWLHSHGRMHHETIDGHTFLMGVTTDVTARKLSEENLRKALEEVRSLRDALEQENTHLREQIRERDGHDAIMGESPAVMRMLADARRVGPAGAVVLITGETGTGKELLAEAIHQHSPRAERGMVKVNCAALPSSLIESELFGREKGAFTGALTQQPGRFEAADGSTIFLDEIAELPLELQAKLLRVLQEGQFERLGSNQTRKVDVRVVAATNRNLEQMVEDGRFRADLFFRLNVFPITVPPLRERRSDIPLLVWNFVRHFAAKMGKPIDSIPRHAMETLKHYHWPGNIRELRNVIERAVILSDSRILRLEMPNASAQTAQPVTLAEAERQHILSALDQANWRVSGPLGAAAVLGLKPTTLHSKMKKLGIARPHAASRATTQAAAFRGLEMCGPQSAGK